MTKKYIILLILSVVFCLQAELISEGIGVRRLLNAKSIERSGYYASYGYEYVDNRFDSTDTSVGHYLLFQYGIIDGFDAIFKLPYYQYSMGQNSLYGFGDVAAGLKFNPDNDEGSFSYAFAAMISLPTGYDQASKYYNKRFSYRKKGYQLIGLVDYSKDYFSIHANLGFFTLDNFEKKHRDDMSFSYSFGAKYRLAKRYNRSFWLKWEFETTHALFNYPDYIEGSNYLGCSVDIWRELSFDAGLVSDLYERNGIGFRVGLSYSGRGSTRVREKKIFEKYGDSLKVGLIEFENENTTKTYETISSELANKCLQADNINIINYTMGTGDLYKGGLESLKRYGDNLVVTGRIVKSGLERDSYLYVPGIVNLPKISYVISIEVTVVDIKSKRKVFAEIVTEETSSSQGVQLFRLRKDDKKSYLSASEEYELIRECRKGITAKILRQLSSRFD